MTVDQLRDRIAALKAKAPDIQSQPDGHLEEDSIREDVLRAIAAGAEASRELAALALTTSDIDIPRWYD